MKDENKEAQSGCLTLAIVGCVIIGFWHHSMLYVALILLIPRYVKYRKLKSEEARREAERQEWESRRQERVVELCDLLRKRDYPLFKDLLKRSYGVLLDDDLVKAQKAFIMVSETEGLKPEVCTDAIAAGRPCYYRTEAEIVQQRQSQGAKYADYDNAVSATLYIFDRTLELVSTGHRVIKIQDILKIMVGGDEIRQICIVLRNVGAPVLLLCPDAVIVQYVVQTLQRDMNK